MLLFRYQCGQYYRLAVRCVWNVLKVSERPTSWQSQWLYVDLFLQRRTATGEEKQQADGPPHRAQHGVSSLGEKQSEYYWSWLQFGASTGWSEKPSLFLTILNSPNQMYLQSFQGRGRKSSEFKLFLIETFISAVKFTVDYCTVLL